MVLSQSLHLLGDAPRVSAPGSYSNPPASCIPNIVATPRLVSTQTAQLVRGRRTILIPKSQQLGAPAHCCFLRCRSSVEIGPRVFVVVVVPPVDVDVVSPFFGVDVGVPPLLSAVFPTMRLPLLPPLLVPPLAVAVVVPPLLPLLVVAVAARLQLLLLLQ